MTSEDTVEDPLMRVQFHIRSKSFSFRVTVHLLFSFLLQNTLKSVLLPCYNFLKLNHNTNCLMISEDTVEDRLRIVQFHIKSKSFSFRLTVHLLFSLLLQKTLKFVFLPPYESLKLNHDTNYLMTSEDTVEDPLMSVQFHTKSKSFSFRVTVHLLFSFLLQNTLKFVFLSRYKSLELNHDINYLKTSEDTVEDPLISVHFYVKSKSFSFRVTVYLLFSFLLQRTPKSLFLPLYESLKLNHDTNYLMTSEDTVEDPLMSNQFYIKCKSFFHFLIQSIYCFHFIAKDA